MSLQLEATEDTPYVDLNENGIIRIEGRSLPENVSLFYTPLIEWANNYVKEPAEETHIRIFLTYYNSSSFKCISEFLFKLREAQPNTRFKVEWIYEEDDLSIYETGKELEEQLEISFQIIEEPIKVKKNRKLTVKNLKSGRVLKITARYWNLIVRNGHSKDFEIMDG